MATEGHKKRQKERKGGNKGGQTRGRRKRAEMTDRLTQQWGVE